MNADRYRFGHAFVRTHVQFDPTAVVNARYYIGAVSPSYTTKFESTTNTSPRRGGCRERCVRESINYLSQSST
jgi:hypothetical protein